MSMPDSAESHCHHLLQAPIFFFQTPRTTSVQKKKKKKKKIPKQFHRASATSCAILSGPTLRHDHHREVVPIDQADIEEVEPTRVVERELGQGHW
jgi:hypothetical protein